MIKLKSYSLPPQYFLSLLGLNLSAYPVQGPAAGGRVAGRHRRSGSKPWRGGRHRHAGPTDRPPERRRRLPLGPGLRRERHRGAGSALPRPGRRPGQGLGRRHRTPALRAGDESEPGAGAAGRPGLARRGPGRFKPGDAGTGLGRPADRVGHGVRRRRHPSPGGRTLRHPGPHPHARRLRESERVERGGDRPI